MFDRLRVAVIAMVFAAAVSSGAAGQTSQHVQEREQLKQRIDSLTPRLWALEKLDSIRQDSIERARARKRKIIVLDSAMIGPFKLIGSKSDVATSRSAAQAAWASLQPLFTNMESDAQGVELVVRRDAARAAIHALKARLTTDARLVTLLSDRRDLWQDAYESAMATVLTARLAPSIRKWSLKGGIGPQSLDPTFRWLILGARRDTVFNPKPAHCTVTDIPECRKVLGFDSQADEFANELMRTSFLSFVARHAKPGAIAASSKDTAPVEAAIEHLGGKPLDEMISEWRQYISDERPQGFQDFGKYFVTTIVWMGAFAALAMRSTRWRLG